MTWSCQLNGQSLHFVNEDVCERNVVGVDEKDLCERKCTIQKVVEPFWDLRYQEYVASLTEQRSKKIGSVAVEVKVGDVVVTADDVVQRHGWKLGLVVRLIEGGDGMVRAA